MAQAKQLLPRRDPADPSYAHIRQKLVAARKAASLSQQALADMIGRPQSFVAKVERGERYLDIVEFSVLAKILKLDVQNIVTRLQK